MIFLPCFKRKLSFLKSIDFPKNIYFIGIGGVGMVGLAKILLDMGFMVSGSDIIVNSNVNYLLSLGVKIFNRHDSKNINNIDIIVYSSAIRKDNIEIITAIKLNIPILSRAKMLSELIRFSYGIAVSGTHGKTTISTLIFDIYYKNNKNPSIVNGGFIDSIRSNAFLGSGDYFIFEADESDSLFLLYYPVIIILTNIEADHLNNYSGNFNKLKDAFVKFLHNLPFYGKAILCIDDLVIRSLLSKLHCKFITYGFDHEADIRIYNYKQIGFKSFFKIFYKNKYSFKVSLNMPGKHNALNAAAAITLAKEDGIRDNDILNVLSGFKGLKRRLEFIGKFSLFKFNGRIGNIIIIDDYGHHPTEINISISTLKRSYLNKRIVMLFQPHRFTRTRDLYNEFIHVLSHVDFLFIFDIYPANELAISNINSIKLCNDIYLKGKLKPIFIQDFNHLIDILKIILVDNDLLLVQGAGDIADITQKLLKILDC